MGISWDEWQNKIHIGIIISLLLRNEHHELEPFYNHFREHDIKSKTSDKIKKQFANELIKVLYTSRIKNKE